MQKIVFYSWQSDLPNATNRGFIQQALEKAATKIVSDSSVEIEPVIDRDTKGIAGSPDIATTIFSKIAAADIFVADISFINSKSTDRHTPNPNVLIELGYALRSLSFERIILIFNQSFGDINDLPFDLRMRRVMTYNMPEIVENRSVERKRLEGLLEDALRAAVKHLPVAEVVPMIWQSIQAIENDATNKVLALRRDLNHILDRLVSLAPPTFSSGGTEQELLDAIQCTQETVADFSKIAEVIVVLKDKACLLELYAWFGKVFDLYNISAGYSGRISDGDFDYFRFLGHEMLVTVFAMLIKEEDWQLIKLLLSQPISIKYERGSGAPSDVYYSYASQWLRGIEREEKKQGKLSLHGFILNERHKDGGLSGIMPINDFATADFYLYLYSEITSKNPDPFGYDQWYPWSIIYLKIYPLFLKKAERRPYASILAGIFKLATVDELQPLLKQHVPNAKRMYTGGYWDLPIRSGDLNKIGTLD
jgi:hypothetical protein